jgi:hypothetical protein
MALQKSGALAAVLAVLAAAFVTAALSGTAAAATKPPPPPKPTKPPGNPGLVIDLSRRNGGIHFTDGDLNGRALGAKVGDAVWAKAQKYFSGTAG